MERYGGSWFPPPADFPLFMLTAYFLTRWACPQCGTFEAGTCDRPDPAFCCPWCDGGLEATAQCRGATIRPLPFLSDPRWEAGGADTPVSRINRQVSDRRRRNHGHGKSTGRKRGGNGRAIYRGPSDQVDREEADRERYRRNKGLPADLRDGLGA